jgi:molybdopterin-guanine dinucleotide biosynthesis protein A
VSVPGGVQPARPLRDAVALGIEKVLDPAGLVQHGAISAEAPVLVVLAAGRGTRFGTSPKCIQPVHGTPLARHSIDAFRWFSPSPVVCVVGYRHEEVVAALGPDNLYVRSADPAGGTAFAAYEALSVPALADADPLLVVAVGDRIVPSAVFRRLWEAHRGDGREAELTFLTAEYEPPKNHGKGRILRDEAGRVVRIVEERDIAAYEDDSARRALQSLTEGNCPLYAIRARALRRHLETLTNDNAQGQYYLTDVVERVSRAGGEIRTITTTPADPEYDLLCSDVTRPMDLALLEGMLSSTRELFVEVEEVEEAARAITADRPAGQVASIACQLEELQAGNGRDRLGFRPDAPVGIGIAGGRLRIAFMHPDMTRFFGPAWQMPIGARDAGGREQIVVAAQASDDGRLHLRPMDPRYQESIEAVPSDSEVMYPGEDISDWQTYEGFGTRVSETLLLSLGYFSDEEIARRREAGLPLPPASRWISSNMRRPFALVGNAIASMRTLREGNLGARVQEHLGRDAFRGLRLAVTGGIPQGGFSSSSAVTVATKNAMNALYGLGIPADVLVHLACQAEYGTGVRAGSLDQATEQKGRAGRGTLISSNPRDNYRILATHPVPAERFRVLFPYSVERDRSTWRWSWGAFAESPGPGPLTAGETRKMTGKAAEIAAVLVHLPLATDFFKRIEDDLLDDGLLDPESRRWVTSVLRQLPLLIGRDELRERVLDSRQWYVEQLRETGPLSAAAAAQKADTALAGLFDGWRDPVLRRGLGDRVVEERGVPLRAMVAYLFAEVAKNFYLVHHPGEWIAMVTASQRGDCSVDIDPDRLPDRGAMEGELPWERSLSGPERMASWLGRHDGRPFDFDRGLDDASLAADNPLEPHRLEGSSFFRGLALIDLAEAMLKRAFGHDAVAVRVNAAGQGDYFQVHVDAERADVEEVKRFIRLAFYRRFGLDPEPDFVEVHPGGGAVGVRLSRYDLLPHLVRALRG